MLSAFVKILFCMFGMTQITNLRTHEAFAALDYFSKFPAVQLFSSTSCVSPINLSSLASSEVKAEEFLLFFKSNANQSICFLSALITFFASKVIVGNCMQKLPSATYVSGLSSMFFIVFFFMVFCWLCCVIFKFPWIIHWAFLMFYSLFWYVWSNIF